MNDINRTLSTRAFTQHGNDAALYNGIHDLETAHAELQERFHAVAEALEAAAIDTGDIIEACGGDWVLEAWEEEMPQREFVLAVMRLMTRERREATNA